MNYVFRDAILNFCKGQHGKYTMDLIMSVIENYPRPVLRVLMNSLSTHDTERAITVMAGEPLDGKDREWQADTKLDDEHKKLGVKLLKVASAMQFTLPGFPCIYYGDEAGMEGYRDPFNRCCYPWGKENKELIEWHKKLADVRKSCSALWDGDFINVLSEERRISYIPTTKIPLFSAHSTSMIMKSRQKCRPDMQTANLFSVQSLRTVYSQFRPCPQNL